MDTDENTPSKTTMTRRGSLVRLAGLAATAIGGSFLETDTAGAGPAAVASGAVTCVLTPELTEGPYYIAGEKVRRNITEGRPGTALTLRTTVVDASNCKPVKGAAVDIWHADAGGLYSGFTSGGSQTPSDTQTFMRGIQRTDAKGLVVFQTVYPGWYEGRAVHIHVKVHIGGSVVHTGQFFFPEATSDAVYRNAPYAARGSRGKRNADDSIFVNGGSKGMLKLTRTSGGYVGAITMGVHTS